MAQIFPVLTEHRAFPPAPSPHRRPFAAATVLSRRSPSGRFSASPASQPASRPRPDLRASQSPQTPSWESPTGETTAFPAAGLALLPMQSPPYTPERVLPEPLPPPPEHFQIRPSPLSVLGKIFQPLTLLSYPRRPACHTYSPTLPPPHPYP